MLQNRSPLFHIVGWGAVSSILYVWIAFLSTRFIYGEGHQDRPILLVLFLLWALVGIQMWMVHSIRNFRPEKKLLGAVLFFAVLFRLILIPSNVIQEDDYYRYLWEGRVSVEGVNPYRYSVWEVEQFRDGVMNPDKPWTDEDRENLKRLVRVITDEPRFALIHDRVNHPDVSTIYPPVGQILFFLSALLFPASVTGFKILIVLVDLGTVCTLYFILTALKMNPLYLLIYAWSPLVVKEFANTGHVDALSVFFLTLTLLFGVRDKMGWAMLFLALSVETKFFPLVVLPLFAYRMYRRSPTDLIRGLTIFFGTVLLLSGPFLGAGGKMFHGLFRYANDWEMNDFLFGLFKAGFGFIPLPAFQSALSFSLFGFTFGSPLYEILAKVTSLVLICLAIGYCIRFRDWSSGEEFILSVFIVLAGTFLLSPVQNPWYMTWLIPFVAVFRFRSWLILSGLILAYYLRFYLHYHGLDEWWPAVVWFEFVPFFVWLWIELRPALRTWIRRT